MRYLHVAVGTLVCVSAWGQASLPWRQWVELPDPETRRPLETLFDLPWRSSGGPEGTLKPADEPGPWGGQCLEFSVKVDDRNESRYPVGWPSFETRPEQPLDFSGYDAISYWIRCDTELDRRLLIRFILRSDGDGRLNTIIPAFAPGEWVRVVHRIRDLPKMDVVDTVHFFICESDYNHGDELTFRVGGFELCDVRKESVGLSPEEAAVGLWLGDDGDENERIVILDESTPTLPALLIAEAGAETPLHADDELSIKYHELFSGRQVLRSRPLGQAADPGEVTRIATEFDIADLGAGYWLVVADVRRDGASVLGGRVGSDDLYIRRADETMTYSVLSIRTGMVMWIRDHVYGGVMGLGRASLPHVYDPLDSETYADFVRLMASHTWKHTEGYEAGCTGLALAAEAFRKSGDMLRCAFAEWLLDDSIDHLIGHMQAPSGGVATIINELGAGRYAEDWAHHFYPYDTNQMGEWMRAITYAIIYYSAVPEKQRRARELSAAVRRAAEFVIAHGVQESDGIPSVMRHLQLFPREDGTLEQRTYFQGGRQCDVYMGRALSGLGYYAYAMQLLGEEVPAHWWDIIDDSVRWAEWKMKPNGWFDWQCEDTVEGGCHTFLGNIYIGEGLFGAYLASRMAGREEPARMAQQAAWKAYRYVTDDCWIADRKWEYPLEFWVGPYVYWLFTHYLDTVGPDDQFEDWLRVLDQSWSVGRGWRDFLDRPADGTGYVGRSSSYGMLTVAILGYLGIKQMEDVGRPLRWQIERE